MCLTATSGAIKGMILWSITPYNRKEVNLASVLHLVPSLTCISHLLFVLALRQTAGFMFLLYCSVVLAVIGYFFLLLNFSGLLWIWCHVEIQNKLSELLRPDVASAHTDERLAKEKTQMWWKSIKNSKTKGDFNLSKYPFSLASSQHPYRVASNKKAGIFLFTCLLACLFASLFNILQILCFLSWNREKDLHRMVINIADERRVTHGGSLVICHHCWTMGTTLSRTTSVFTHWKLWQMNT